MIATIIFTIGNSSIGNGAGTPARSTITQWRWACHKSSDRGRQMFPILPPLRQGRKKPLSSWSTLPWRNLKESQKMNHPLVRKTGEFRHVFEMGRYNADDAEGGSLAMTAETAYRRVVAAYPDDCQPHDVNYLAGAGGF